MRRLKNSPTPILLLPQATTAGVYGVLFRGTDGRPYVQICCGDTLGPVVAFDTARCKISGMVGAVSWVRAIERAAAIELCARRNQNREDEIP